MLPHQGTEVSHHKCTLLPLRTNQEEKSAVSKAATKITLHISNAVKLQKEKNNVKWTYQSLLPNVSIDNIFKGCSSLQDFNDVAGFVSESFHLNRIPLIRQS